MVILNLYGVPFHAAIVIALRLHFLFKFILTLSVTLYEKDGPNFWICLKYVWKKLGRGFDLNKTQRNAATRRLASSNAVLFVRSTE